MNLQMNLQMFAGAAETGSSGLSGDFDADFAKYVSHTEPARQDAAVENDDADTGAADETEDAPDTDSADSAAEENNTPTETSTTDTDNAEMTDDEFEALIKGKGKKAFGARTQKIIDGRFAKIKGQMQPLQDLAAVLYDKYGISDGDIDALKQAVYDDNAMFNRQAMESGQSIQEYKDSFKAAQEQSQADAQAEIEQQIEDDNAAADAQNDIINAWQSQCDAVKATYPEFDLQKELTDNEDFRDLLTGARPLTVEEARRLAYYDRDMAEITGKVAQSVKAKTANAIQQNKQRPPEGGLTRQGGIIPKKDVSALRDNDILKILDEVSKGAKITF